MNETPADISLDVETFRSPWPGVLAEMKDYLDLWFLAGGARREATALRIFISKTLVPQSRLQPHVRDWRASLATIRNCRIELKGTEQTEHRIEIEYRR
jgi:hypothetical protein